MYQYKYYCKEVTNGIPCGVPKYANTVWKNDKLYEKINNIQYMVIFGEDMRNFVLDYYSNVSNPGALCGRDALFAAI